MQARKDFRLVIEREEEVKRGNQKGARTNEIYYTKVYHTILIQLPTIYVPNNAPITGGCKQRRITLISVEHKCSSLSSSASAFAGDGASIAAYHWQARAWPDLLLQLRPGSDGISWFCWTAPKPSDLPLLWTCLSFFTYILPLRRPRSGRILHRKLSKSSSCFCNLLVQ